MINWTVKNVHYKTLSAIKSAKFSDCCVSFRFGSQNKIGFIRAILMDKQDENKIFVLLEELIDEPKKQLTNCLQVKTSNGNSSTVVPNIYVRIRSSCLILRLPSDILQKHSYRILSNQETVEIIELP